MVRRTKAAALETREAILDAAQQVFHEQGVSSASLEEIAKAAGVTRGAIYHHFRNKADLFDAIHERAVLPMQDVLHRLVQAKGDDGLERLETFCVDSFIRLHENAILRRTFTVLMLKCEASGEMEGLLERLRETKAESVAKLEAFFRQQQEAGAISNATEPRLLALGLHDYMTGLFMGYLRAPSSYRMPEDARSLVHHFFAPLHR